MAEKEEMSAGPGVISRLRAAVEKERTRLVQAFFGTQAFGYVIFATTSLARLPENTMSCVMISTQMSIPLLPVFPNTSMTHPSRRVTQSGHQGWNFLRRPNVLNRQRRELFSCISVVAHRSFVHSQKRKRLDIKNPDWLWNAFE